MLLEYNEPILDASVEDFESQNIRVTAIRNEEQLHHVDLTTVDLVLVGEGWTEATVAWLRESGVHVPFLYVASEIRAETYERARDVGCVDVVAYPLSMKYLREWAKETSANGTQSTQAPQKSKLEKLLDEKRAERQASETSERREERGFLSPARMRAKILTCAGVRGAVGKTTATLLVARTLVERGYSVAVIDLVPRGILLDIFNQQSPVTIDDWVKMPSQMDERMVRQSLTLIRNGGFWLLPSGQSTEDIGTSDVRKVVYSIASYFDFVLIDTNHGHKITDVALEMATKVLYVMVPDWKAVKRDLEGLSEVVAQKGADNVVVLVNRMERRKSEHKAALRFYDEADIESPMVHLLEDNVLRREMDRNRPILGSRSTQSSVRDLVESTRLMPVAQPQGPRQRRRWFR